MQYRIERWLKTLNDLRSMGVKYLSINSLINLTNMKKESLRVALWRLRKKGLIYKIGKWYIIPPVRIEEIAVIVQIPCYVSLEWILFKHNIIDQAPYVCTCITTKKPRIINTPLGSIEYKHIKKELFFGYNEQLLAYPEKALLDLVYFRRHKGLTINVDEIDLEMLMHYVKKYPKYVREEIRRLF